jgi:cytochrome P450
MKLTDFTTPSFLENPYPVYEALRAEGPLVPLGPNAVISGHYDIVDALLHDRRVGRNYMDSVRFRYGEEGAKSLVFQGIGRMFLMLNPPVHTRLRTLMMKVFNARQIDAMRDAASAAAHELIDGFEHARSADLTSAFAFPLPVGIICRLLDIPVADAQRLGQAASSVAKALDAAPIGADDIAKASAGYASLEKYFSEIIDARSARIGSDPISLLLSVEENGERLSRDEIIANVILLFIAGHETTSNMLGNALIALHRHPEQLDLLKRDLSRMPKAVLECLRYDGSVQMTIRSPQEDIDIAGVTLRRGTTVFLALGSANRDPSKFKDPDRLEIDRDDARPLSFGAGIHHCLGYRLALIELEAALRALIERLPQLRLPDLETLRWNQRGNLRGVESLMAAW